jgi:urease accessory protein
MSIKLRESYPSAQAVSSERAAQPLPGTARVKFCRTADGKTSLAEAFATSPLRLLTPRNHGDAAWVFLSSYGGGLVDGDRLDVRLDVGPGASGLLGTQASTKVYRSRPREARDGGFEAAATTGCGQKLSAAVGEGASLALLPDPVVCFADARYAQTIDVALAPTASLVALDGYTCGRSARGERWAFSRYASRTTVTRAASASKAARPLVDATLLDPRHGSIAERMGRFDVVLSLIAIGPRFAQVREAMLAVLPPDGCGDAVLVAASPLGSGDDGGHDGCIVRVAAERFELASLALRSSFAALAHGLGDDPFARKW